MSVDFRAFSKTPPERQKQAPIRARLTRRTLLLACTLIQMASAGETILLWPKDDSLNSPDKMGASKESGGKTRVSNIGTPHLDLRLADKGTKPSTAIILCPGGGYSKLVPSLHWPIAKWLNEQGISAFILMYRCPSDRTNGEAVPDIQRAIRIVRSRAAEWNIDPMRIGVLGTSAGGNLCARASLSFDRKFYQPADKVDAASCRPDFTVLFYPAYLAHRSTREPAPWIKVPKNMPPTLIFAAKDDRSHFPGSPIYEQALKTAGASVQSHYFETGGHGFGLNGPDAVATWPRLCLDWLKEIKALP